MHGDELRLNWARGRKDEPLVGIGPLPRIDAVDLAVHLHRITEVEVVGEHWLRVAFDEGARGESDASGWSWRGVFAALC